MKVLEKICIKSIICIGIIICLVCMKQGDYLKKEQKVITIGYQIPTSVTWGATIMKRKYLVEKELEKEGFKNYKVEWKSTQSGSPLVNLMKSGKLDIAFLGDMPAIIALSKSQKTKSYDPKLIGIDGFGKNGVGQCIVVRKKDKINSGKQLGNKRVATSFGSSADRLLREAFTFSKIKHKKPIEYMDLNVAKLSLDKGNVDAISVWAPYTVLTASREYKDIFDGKKTKRNYISLVVANKSTLQNYRVLNAVKKALMRSHKIINKKKSNAIKCSAYETGFNRKIVNKVFKIISYKSIKPEDYINTIKSDFMFINRTKLVKQNYTWEEFKNEKIIF